MPKVSIIIINFNGGALNNQCLAALDRQTFRDFEIILVDNASTDGSLATVDCSRPNLTVIPSPTNTGFAGGNNLGAKSAQGAWLALLNNDAFPDPDWLEHLVKAAEAHPEFDFFSSRQYCFNAPHLMDGTGDMLATNGRAWRRDYHVPAWRATNISGEVFGACAAAAMYRRSDFEATGGFDEDFFCHFEDVDLAFRLRLIGKRCFYANEAVVYHIGSATAGGEDSDFAVYQGMRNAVWTYAKCMPRGLLLKNLHRHLLRNARELYYALRTGKGRVALRAKFHALKALPKMLRKRRAIQLARTVADADIAAWLLRDPGHMPVETEIGMGKTERDYA